MVSILEMEYNLISQKINSEGMFPLDDLSRMDFPFVHFVKHPMFLKHRMLKTEWYRLIVEITATNVNLEV